MPNEAKKLLGNQSLGVSVRVTAERMQKAGVKVKTDVQGRKFKTSKSAAAIPKEMIKQLAGT